MEATHYLIKQTIPHLPVNIIKIYEPFNRIHFQKLIDKMFGNIEIFKYDINDNSRVDLTKKFFLKKFNIYDYTYENMFLISLNYNNKHTKNIYIKYYCILAIENEKNMPPLKFYMNGQVLTHNGVSCEFKNNGFFSSNIEDYKQKINFGSEYEKFIAKKYETLSYDVKLNGIQNSVNDGGIDLIAIKDNKIVLVQCKNWSLSNSYKLNQKDFRAFIGDCYLYIRNNDTVNKKIAFHFIASHNNILTKSAEIFLKQNDVLKFKVVPFELGECKK